MAYRKIKLDGTQAKSTHHEHKRKGKQKKVDVDTFKRVVNEYLLRCEEKKQIPLIQELCLLLGISREALSNYRKFTGYRDVIKRIDELTEIALINKGLNENKPVFSMFLLKSKFGYIEQQYQKVDLNVSGQLGVVQMPAKKK